MQSLTTVANATDFNTTFTAEYDKDHTALALITPSSGKKIRVTGVKLSTEGAAAAGAKVRVYFATSGDTIATIYCTNAVQNTIIDSIIVTGAIDEVVSITSNLGDDKNYYLSINYKEL